MVPLLRDGSLTPRGSPPEFRPRAVGAKIIGEGDIQANGPCCLLPFDLVSEDYSSTFGPLLLPLFAGLANASICHNLGFTNFVRSLEHQQAPWRCLLALLTMVEYQPRHLNLQDEAFHVSPCLYGTISCLEKLYPGGPV